MKCYVVVQEWDEGAETIFDIFDSKEKAREFKKELNKARDLNTDWDYCFSQYAIKEYEISEEFKSTYHFIRVDIWKPLFISEEDIRVCCGTEQGEFKLEKDENSFTLQLPIIDIDDIEEFDIYSVYCVVNKYLENKMTLEKLTEYFVKSNLYKIGE